VRWSGPADLLFYTWLGYIVWPCESPSSPLDRPGFRLLRSPRSLASIQLQPLVTGIDRPVYSRITTRGDLHHRAVRQGVRYENGQLRKKPYLDLSKKVNNRLRVRLLSIRSPDFAHNGYLYATTPALIRA